MKHFISVFFIFTFSISKLLAQNIECIGNTIQIPLVGYKAGDIQWQFSTNESDWQDISGANSEELNYTITESGFFRGKVIFGNCQYFSEHIYISAFPEPTVANAGEDRVISSDDLTVFLSGNAPEAGTGKWTIISGSGGSFENDILPNTAFTGSQCSDYVLRWTISTDCNSSSDDLIISFHTLPTTANAGTDHTLDNADTTMLLAANSPLIGTGKWMILSGGSGSFANDENPTTIFTGRQCTEYIIRWTISTGCNSSSDNVNIGFEAVPSEANAGFDQTINSSTTTVNLSANSPASGSGKWSIISGGAGSFTNENSPTTTFTGSQCTDYDLRWTISTACSNTMDDVIIGFHAIPTVATAGADRNIYNGSTTATLSANSPLVGTGHWSIIEGTSGSFADASSPNTTFTGSFDTKYILRWTISTTCSSTIDELKINIYNPANIVLDASGNIYPIVTIGSQVWMKENLRTKIFNDGSNIPRETDPDVWYALTTPAYCWYNNDSVSNSYPYGALYNGYAVYTGKLCPTGWHVPSDDDWNALASFLGGASLAGGKLKESGTSHWVSPNTGATNETGFTALPGGYSAGGFYNIGSWGYWWSYPVGGTGSATPRVMNYGDRSISGASSDKNLGFSVRCIKN